jgi:hypothetical protein
VRFQGFKKIALRLQGLKVRFSSSQDKKLLTVGLQADGLGNQPKLGEQKIIAFFVMTQI